MTKEYENMSALVDGEPIVGESDADKNTLVSAIASDASLKAKWRSYHLTRDLLRNDMSNDVNFDISDKVAAALDDELPIIAPKSTWRDLPVVSAVIPVLRQSGQLAMVACVTAVVIFGFQTYNQPEATDPFVTAAPYLGPQGGLAPVSLQSTNNSSQDRMSQLLEQRRQLNALIQDHVRQQRLRDIDVKADLSEQSVELESTDDGSQ